VEHEGLPGACTCEGRPGGVEPGGLQDQLGVAVAALPSHRRPGERDHPGVPDGQDLLQRTEAEGGLLRLVAAVAGQAPQGVGGLALDPAERAARAARHAAVGEVDRARGVAVGRKEASLTRT
jgi:hypothetical protein